MFTEQSSILKSTYMQAPFVYKEWEEQNTNLNNQMVFKDGFI